jgi:hypothetical protein
MFNAVLGPTGPSWTFSWRGKETIIWTKENTGEKRSTKAWVAVGKVKRL